MKALHRIAASMMLLIGLGTSGCANHGFNRTLGAMTGVGPQLEYMQAMSARTEVVAALNREREHGVRGPMTQRLESEVAHYQQTGQVGPVLAIVAEVLQGTTPPPPPSRGPAYRRFGAGTPVYDASQCTGPVIGGVCHGGVIGQPQQRCHGAMLNGQCTGPVF